MKKQLLLLAICLMIFTSCFSPSEDQSEVEIQPFNFGLIPYINILNQDKYTVVGECLNKGLNVEYTVQEIVDPTHSRPPLNLEGSVTCEEDRILNIGPFDLSALPEESNITIIVSALGFEKDIKIIKDISPPTVELDTIQNFVNPANKDQFPLSGHCSESGTVIYRVGTVKGETPCSESEGWNVLVYLSDQPSETLDIEITMRDMALNQATTPITSSVVKDTQAPKFADGTIGIPSNDVYQKGELNFYSVTVMVTSLTSGETYNFYAKAFDSAGNESSCSVGSGDYIF